MKKFPNNLEDKIGNNFIPIIDLSNPEKIYYSTFDTVIEEDSKDLPYGDDFIDLKNNEIIPGTWIN